MMRKILFLIVLSLVMVNQMAFSKKTNNQKNKTTINWNPLIEAIIKVESNGNNKAVSKDGSCVGPMQIKMVLVKDCNYYLKQKGVKKRYTSKDRYSREKSAEMFKLIMERYNKTNSTKIACFIWNQGVGYKKRLNKATRYYNKVLKHYKRVN